MEIEWVKGYKKIGSIEVRNSYNVPKYQNVNLCTIICWWLVACLPKFGKVSKLFIVTVVAVVNIIIDGILNPFRKNNSFINRFSVKKKEKKNTKLKMFRKFSRRYNFHDRYLLKGTIMIHSIDSEAQTLQLIIPR